MNEVKKMLFLQQRFHILSLFSSSKSQCNITPGYAYAWFAGVYPSQSKTAVWHLPYKDQFEINDEAINSLHELLSDRWSAKNPIGFLELEGHLGFVHQGEVWSSVVEEIAGKSLIEQAFSTGGWNRSKLCKACRYLYLTNCLDADLWGVLLERTPELASVVTGEFGAGNICFE